MPKTRMLPATRAARTERRSSALRTGRKPTYVARLLATLHGYFKESGMTRSYISDIDLLEKIREEASEIGEELGKRFDSSTQRALALLRRNHYVEYKPQRTTNTDAILRITKDLETILDTVDEALDGFTSLSDFEMHSAKCEYLRVQVQPKSRKLPSCAELDRENRILEDDNRRLVQENRELEEEITEMREEREEETARPTQPSLQRQDTVMIDAPPLESGMTDSMYDESALESSVLQPLIRQPSNAQTPLRPRSFRHAMASYMTPESPPGVARSLCPPATSRGLTRTDSHLFTPPATPEPPHLTTRSSRSHTPAFDGDAFDDDDEGLQDPSMDIDPAPIDLEKLLEVSMAQAQLEFENAELLGQLEKLRATTFCAVGNVTSAGTSSSPPL
ncbi:hypothetical protein CPB83DRAFT_183434 [Crepidotus variabilis]|uniref:Uncharacterized protein n=1 Tax=Crepidotus variabilis TaxID=179855 RepID=A0A9P6JS69_9AGAR|nr:hypothetical protein CPB83DRAFT_183434 [Crepidotus variabilis]